MNTSLRIFLIVALVLYFLMIFVLLKRKRISMKYSLMWLFFGLIMIFVVAFPQVLATVIHAFGIVELTNGIFAMGLFALLLLTMALTSIVSTLNGKIRSLTQTCALYEKRIRELEISSKQEK